MKRPWDGSLDVLRTGAAVLVVLLHCSGSLRPLAEFGPEWWGTALLQAFTRSAVPLFVMISGALLIGPETENLAAFYRRRASRILVPLIFWMLFYQLISTRGLSAERPTRTSGISICCSASISCCRQFQQRTVR